MNDHRFEVTAKPFLPEVDRIFKEVSRNLQKIFGSSG